MENSALAAYPWWMPIDVVGRQRLIKVARSLSFEGLGWASKVTVGWIHTSDI